MSNVASVKGKQHGREGEKLKREQGELLFQPAANVWETSRMGQFLTRLKAEQHADFTDYHGAWQFSVDHPETFWQAIATEFATAFVTPPTAILSYTNVADATWFAGSTLNYVSAVLAQNPASEAIIAVNQNGDETRVTYAELAAQIGACAAGLTRLGVNQGDRVVGYLPNAVAAVVAFLATASIGAVWSSCAPEFGVRAVIDRVQQIAPKVFIAADGYLYGAKQIDRRANIAAIYDALDSVEALVIIPVLYDTYDGVDVADSGIISWATLTATNAPLTPKAVPFDHPLYILFSSGTTGLPKAIVHGHGGNLLELQKSVGLHLNVGPGSRMFWFTTTGWMMWNYLVSALTLGATIVLYDGDPGYPDLNRLWALAAQTKITLFGVSAPFIMACRKADLNPTNDHDLSSLDVIASTGSPLATDGFFWVHDTFGPNVQLASVSGGTDLCTAFVGAAPLLPIYAGEISAPSLGARIEAFANDGTPVTNGRGELVITLPMPSMPVSFFNDPDGSKYHDAYYAVYPGIWRHGDWLEFTRRGSLIISGRSDATLNRGGVRMGTAEFTAAVEELAEIKECLIVHLDGDDDTLVLFVVPASGPLTDALTTTIKNHIRQAISPRHVPDEIYPVAELPLTISGKRMEIPVKRLLQGADAATVANPGAMANPAAFDLFVALANQRASQAKRPT